MKKTRKIAIFGLGLLFSFIIIFSFKYFTWLPLINNILLGINFIIIASLNIWILIVLIEIKTKNNCQKIWKIIGIILFLAISAIVTFFVIIASIFSGKTNNKIEFKNKVYYYQDEGFLDPYYVFYRKNSPFTMEKLHGYYYLPELNEKNLEKLINGSYEKEENKSKEANEEKIPLDKEPIKKEIKPLNTVEREELINKYKGPEHIKKVEGSNYVVVSVDKAMHKNLYYFGIEEGEKIKYISELPENSAFVEGLVEDEEIKLTFKDTNGKLYKYKSKDQGLSWKKEE